MKNQRSYSPEETAAAVGISKQTLLRYEKKGVFPRPHRNPINKWREYTEDDIKKLKKVLGRKDEDFE